MPDQLHDAKIFANKFRYNADKISNPEKIDPDLYNEIWRSTNDIDKSYNFDKGCLYEKLKKKYNVKTELSKEVNIDLVLNNNSLQFKFNIN